MSSFYELSRRYASKTDHRIEEISRRKEILMAYFKEKKNHPFVCICPGGFNLYKRPSTFSRRLKHNNWPS